jgi:hypothetical protein
MTGIASLTWDTLRPLGFEPEERPDTGVMPRLPDDVTDLHDDDLMGLFTELTEWSCYAASQLADAWSRERSAEQDLAAAVAQAAVRARTERTVAAQKAVVAADPLVQDEEEALLKISALRRALEAVNANAERRAQLISRELSRRIARRDRDARQQRWGGG